MPVSKVTGFSAGAVGKVYRCSVVATSLNGVHINTFHLRQIVASFSGNIYNDIATTWNGAVKPSYLALFSNFLTLQYMNIAEVDDSLKGLPSQSVTLSGSGTRSVSTEYLPGQCAALVEFNTGFSGRAGRGRQFIGQLVEGDQNAGNVASAFQTLMQTYGSALVDTFQAANSAVAELVIFSKKTNTVAVVLTAQPKTVVYTQRRRRLGVGS